MLYLKLKFRDAKLYRGYKTKNKIFYTDNINKKGKFNYLSKDSSDSNCYLYPINKYQIYNVLSILFGNRPISTKYLLLDLETENDLFSVSKHRNSFIDKYIWDKANNSYIDKKFNDLDCYFIGNYLNAEFKLTDKSQFDSYPKKIIPTKEIFENFCGSHISKIKELINEIINNSYDIFNMTEIQQKIANSDKNEKMFEYLENNKMLVLRNYYLSKVDINEANDGFIYLAKYKNWNNIPSYKHSLHTNNSGVDDMVFSFDGSIYVPINDSDVNTLNEKSKLFAKILDGGLVSIDGIISDDDINLDKDNIIVSNIPTTQVKYKEFQNTLIKYKNESKISI